VFPRFFRPIFPEGTPAHLRSDVKLPAIAAEWSSILLVGMSAGVLRSSSANGDVPSIKIVRRGGNGEVDFVVVALRGPGAISRGNGNFLASSASKLG